MATATATELAKAVFEARGRVSYDRRLGWVLDRRGGGREVLGKRRAMLVEAARSARNLARSLQEERERASELAVSLSDVMAERDMMSVPQVKDPSVALVHARAEILRLKAELTRRQQF